MFKLETFTATCDAPLSSVEQWVLEQAHCPVKHVCVAGDYPNIEHTFTPASDESNLRWFAHAFCARFGEKTEPPKVDRVLISVDVLLAMPVRTHAEVEAFILALFREGLGYHFEEAAKDCLAHLVSEEDAEGIGQKVALCYAVWDSKGDCPIGYALKVIDTAG